MKILEKLKKIGKSISSPDEIFSKFLNWFDGNRRLGFFVAIFVGLITHITMISETLMSQDGLWNSMDYFRCRRLGADSWSMGN